MLRGSGAGLSNGTVPSALALLLKSEWDLVDAPGSLQQVGAAQAPYGEERAEEALFPFFWGWFLLGRGRIASPCLWFQVGAVTSSPFQRKRGWSGQCSCLVEMLKPGVPRVCQDRIPACFCCISVECPSSPRASVHLSPPRPAGISPQCPRKEGSSHLVTPLSSSG